MSEPKPQLITRKACALYFANRALVSYLISHSFLIVPMLFILQSTTGDKLYQSLFTLFQVWLFTAPLVWIVGLLDGDHSWRSLFDPVTLGPANYYKFRWFLILGAFGVVTYRFRREALLILALIYIVVAIMFVFFELYSFQFRRVYELRIAPKRYCLYIALACALLFHLLWLYAIKAKAPRSTTNLQAAIGFQQLIGAFGTLGVQVFWTFHVLDRWRNEGRLPKEGNPRFQFDLSHLLIFAIGAGVWALCFTWLFL